MKTPKFLFSTTVEEAVKKQKANTSVIFVPPAFAADAILEAANAGIKVIICITEEIPAADMLKAYNSIKNKDVILIVQTARVLSPPEKQKLVSCPALFISWQSWSWYRAAHINLRSG